MSQDLRDYDLLQVDQARNEAHELGVTATVGPSGHGRLDGTRGVQITLATSGGVAYARVTEAQVRDLIRVLATRVNPDAPFEATGWRGDRLTIRPDGSIGELERFNGAEAGES